MKCWRHEVLIILVGVKLLSELSTNMLLIHNDLSFMGNLFCAVCGIPLLYAVVWVFPQLLIKFLCLLTLYHCVSTEHGTDDYCGPLTDSFNRLDTVRVTFAD